MSFENVSVREAREKQREGYTYVDVRSIPEFEQGHPAGAVNVPLIHGDVHTGQMMANREFLDVMRANFPSDAKLLIGCQIGARSVQAAETLLLAGFDRRRQRARRVRGHSRSADRCGARGRLDPRGPPGRERPPRRRLLRRSACEARRAGARRRVIARAFHGWERRLASAATDRIVRPFEWGLDWIDDRDAIDVPDPAAWLEGWAERRHCRRARASTHVPPCADYVLDGDRLDVPERDRHAASREQRGPRALLSRIRRREAARRAVLVLPQWNADAERPRRPVPAVEPVRHQRAAAHPALPRRAHAARAPARRLHRQRQRRPDGAGLPPGGARRAARDRLAGARRDTSRSASSARASDPASRC